jgi:hypothetical protein
MLAIRCPIHTETEMRSYHQWDLDELLFICPVAGCKECYSEKRGHLSQDDLPSRSQPN